jgi:hypothetical protein
LFLLLGGLSLLEFGLQRVQFSLEVGKPQLKRFLLGGACLLKGLQPTSGIVDLAIYRRKVASSGAQLFLRGSQLRSDGAELIARFYQGCLCGLTFSDEFRVSGLARRNLVL